MLKLLRTVPIEGIVPAKNFSFSGHELGFESNRFQRGRSMNNNTKPSALGHEDQAAQTLSIDEFERLLDGILRSKAPESEKHSAINELFIEFAQPLDQSRTSS
jgi:hypothetical protein